MRYGSTIKFLALAFLILLLAGLSLAQGKQTIYVDTSGIDARGDLTAQQKSDLKSALISKIQANVESAVGAGNVEVTNDPDKKAGASRTIEIKNEFSNPPGDCWGERVQGSGTATVFLKEFMDDPAESGSFKTGGNWDVDKLANGLHHTGCHELGHTFCVGHNSNLAATANKMTQGGLAGGYTTDDKATKDWEYDQHSKDGIKAKWGQPACAAAVDYLFKALSVYYGGEPSFVSKPEDVGGVDATFDYAGPMAAAFEFGYLGPDSDGGLEDRNAQFDFLFQSAMRGDGVEAELITFYNNGIGNKAFQFVLRGATGSLYEGDWFILPESGMVLSVPDINGRYKVATMSWDVDGNPGVDVTVVLDTRYAFGLQTNLYNAFEKKYIPGPMYPQRSNPDGTLVSVSGIVTLSGDRIYIEEPDRSSGICVNASDPDINRGDDIHVVGLLSTQKGMRTINPTQPISVLSEGKAIPEPFGMRCRDVGGRAADEFNPGITNGRGPLNVGLLVHIGGLVTAVDPDGDWFYVWDGSNMYTLGVGGAPLDDGSGNWGVRVVSDKDCVPWVDWVEVTGVVSTNDTAVPGKVIPEILPYDGPWRVDSFFDVYAPLGTLLPYPKRNLVSVTAAPANLGMGDPEVFQPWDPAQVFPPGRTEEEIDGRLNRYETICQGTILYDMEREPSGPFGGVLLGDGYWLRPAVSWLLSYTGLPSTLDQWIATGRAGWRLIGHPQQAETSMEDLQVHSGSEIKSCYDASQWEAGWIYSIGNYYVNSISGTRFVGLPDDEVFDDRLRPWHGYWFRFLQNDKAFIVPGKPKLEFYQLDFDLDEVVVPNSEWGWVGLTYSGSPNIQYFNLTANGVWVVQDLAVLSTHGVGVPQTVYISFDLGVPRGTDVGSLSYVSSLTPSVLGVPPSGTATAATVSASSYCVDSGSKGDIVALIGSPPIFPGQPVPPGAWAYISGMPNQECLPGHCVPTAVSNSLQYLNTNFGLGLTAAQTSEGTMQTATGYDDSPPPGCYSNWPDTKNNYMNANGYGVNTSTTTNFDDVLNAVNNGYDVELRCQTHCATVVGCAKQADGKYVLTISHDSDQNTNPGGCKEEEVIYDPATNTYSGAPSFDGQSPRPAVIEQPGP